LDNFPEILEQVVWDSQRKRIQFLTSTKTPVDNPIETINSLGKQYGLTQEETKNVEKAFYLEDGETMFSVINAFTRAAQESDLSASESYKLEKVGGQILSLVK
jgi:hypothetical protein